MRGFFFVFVLDDGDDLLLNSVTVEADLPLRREGDLAGDHRIERVILADLYILTSLDLGAALAHDDLARACCLAVSELHPEIFRV